LNASHFVIHVAANAESCIALDALMMFFFSPHGGEKVARSAG
jgi:hypothetical protein